MNAQCNFHEQVIKSVQTSIPIYDNQYKMSTQQGTNEDCKL